jgi:hypothetical protein
MIELGAWLSLVAKQRCSSVTLLRQEALHQNLHQVKPLLQVSVTVTVAGLQQLNSMKHSDTAAVAKNLRQTARGPRLPWQDEVISGPQNIVALCMAKN